MDTLHANGAPAATGDKRDKRQAADADTACRPPTATTATGDNRDNRVTRSEAAARLGVSVPALRRLQRRAAVPGTQAPAPHGGTQVTLSADDLAVLRAVAATTATGDNRQAASAPAGRLSRQATSESSATSDNRQVVDPPASPIGDTAAGWRELTAELRSEADRLRADLAVTRERLDQLERRAGEAERGRLEAAARVEALRAAWWRWYALAQARPWWRRRLPDPPAELTSGPALPPPR